MWSDGRNTIKPFVVADSERMITWDQWQALVLLVNEWYNEISDAQIANFNTDLDRRREGTGSNNREWAPVPEPQQQAGWIYVLRGEGYYKIGKTKTLDQRVAQISPALPFPVELVHSISSDDTTRDERILHERFAAKRANGEWFTLDDDDLAWLLAQ